LDPTAVGRFDDKRPLVVPILSHLDVGMEEANSAFQSATEIRPEDLVSEAEDYLISANDLLAVTISDLGGPGADQIAQRRVTESGRVSLPMIGQLPASGRTEADLEREIVEAYRNAGLIQNAQVSVTVAEARGRTFTIVGPGVTRAGLYPMNKADFRVLDALAAVGDVQAFSDTMYVMRNTGPRNTPATMPAREEGAGTTPGQAPEPGSNLAPPAQPQPQTPGVAPATGPGQVAPPPAPPAPGTGEGRIVIIDGKPVLIEGGQTQPAPAQPQQPVTPAATPEGTTGTTETSTTTTTTTVTPGTTAAPSPETQPQTSDDEFEFNRLTTENQRVIRVSLAALRNGDMKNNIVIRPGDTLIVPGPVVGEYYMAGHIGAPGAYSLTGRQITLKQAVAAARMFDQIAIPRRTEIIRRLGPDREVVIGVDLDAVFAGTQPDVYLKPNDTVNVGTNLWAPFLAAIRGGFRTSYGFGFLYDRNYAARDNNAGIGNND
jgi:protein involved in polysaccharide export with SLBB domain